jgi:signal transduction histidine kinase
VTPGEILRSQHLEIGREWLAEMHRTQNESLQLKRSVLVDHLPEFLLALAHWVDGDTHGAQRGFDALAEGHALTRLGNGISLGSLTAEYAILRGVIMQHVMAGPLDAQDRARVVLLNAGLDRAINDAVERYTSARETTRETFIAILGHDLRNPLAAVRMAAQRIAALGVAEAEKHVQVIERAGGRMERLIVDLLDFARGRLGGGFRVEPRDEDMGDLCRVAIDEIDAARSGRTIHYRHSGNLLGRWDRDRVVQALANLLINAVDHGADPIEVEARSDGAEAVVTEIRNVGAEIPEEVVRTMFDPFNVRARGAASSSGLGLGLYIVHEIVLAHGGTIDVKQEDSVVFSIRWPRAARYP